MSVLVENKKYRMVGRVVLRRIGQDQLLVPVSGTAARTNAVFPLNRTGVFIWEQLTSNKTVAETASALAHAFAIDDRAALADCEQFVEQLIAQQLLEIVPS